MPKQKTDDLIQLIKSLTRAEKRHFRLFVRRNQSSDDILFLQLFDFLDHHKIYDEHLILKKLPGIKKRQLSNLKAHLYKQLLTSLRLLNKNHNEDIQVREMIDYAKVLYNKGLYRQSLEMLEKAKTKAHRVMFDGLVLTIVEFEKLIEGQYITGSIEGRAEELTQETLRLDTSITQTNLFSNLALQLYGLYLRVGYVRNSKDYYFVREFFHSNLPQIDFQQLGFWGKIYYCQSYLWFYHMTQDFPMAYRYAQKWVVLFNEQPEMKAIDAAMYLKGMHNLLGALYNTLQYKKFVETLEELNRFKDEFDLSLDHNIEGLYYLFKYIHTIEKHYLEGTFTEGLVHAPIITKLIAAERYSWDDHRILVFYYRIACLYFASGDNNNAIHYLNLIINQKNPDYREDIQCFARILNLIAHFELGNAQLVEYQIKSVYRFLSKMEDLHGVQKEIFRFLRKTPKMRANEMKSEFMNLKEKLVKLEDLPLERRPFLYLDIISWLESKIEDTAVQTIIRRKFLNRIVKK
ncbi:MAG: hypothetical protein R2828_33880 [Saprospiraceae bacterium]